MSNVYKKSSSDDLFGTTSFGGGGGGGGGGAKAAIGTLNRITEANCGYTSACNPSDPQGTWGRPTFDKGDAYSGDQTYGSPDGR